MTAVDFRLDDNVALVTGAASGIGRAAAEAIAAAGAAVGLVDLTESATEPVAESITAAGGRAVPLGADAPARARRAWRPALAAAATVVLAAGAYRLMQPASVPVVPAEQTAPIARPSEPAATPTTAAPSTPPANPPANRPAQSGTVPLVVLSPPTRSATDVRVISVPEGNSAVEFWLELEGDDFPEYDAALKDAAGARTLWRSGRVRAQGPESNRIVRVRVPANLLTPRRHTIELRGSPARGGAQVLSAYPFRVVVQ